MSITSRKVKNKKNSDGTRSGKPGTVYDVNIKYKDSQGDYQTYGKRGFLNKKDAENHENQMLDKLNTGTLNPAIIKSSKETVAVYMRKWIEIHEKGIRPNTIAGYRNQINKYIIPNLGNIPINQLTGEHIDNVLTLMSVANLSNSSKRYFVRVLSIALEHARKRKLIDSNPTKDIITTIGADPDTPVPFDVKTIQALLYYCKNTKWEMITLLGGLYGLRRNEMLGLTWDRIDFKNSLILIDRQLPDLHAGTKIIKEFAPPKSENRMLTISEITVPYFIDAYEKYKHDKKITNKLFYDNNLVISKPDGVPFCPQSISSDFSNVLKKLDMRHIRLHDLRHSAGTNIYALSHDFLGVAKILGHSSIKSLSKVTLDSFKENSNIKNDVTSRYIDVHLEQIRELLDKYHSAVFANERDLLKQENQKVLKRNKTYEVR